MMTQTFFFIAFKLTLVVKCMTVNTNPDFGLFLIIQEIAYLIDIGKKANLFLLRNRKKFLCGLWNLRSEAYFRKLILLFF